MAGFVFLVDVVDGEDAAVGGEGGPGVAEVGVAAVGAEDDFGGRLEISALGIEHAGADAVGFVAVAVD